MSPHIHLTAASHGTLSSLAKATAQRQYTEPRIKTRNGGGREFQAGPERRVYSDLVGRSTLKTEEQEALSEHPVAMNLLPSTHPSHAITIKRSTVDNTSKAFPSRA